ncbi:MAG: hypothetical protein Q8L29_03385 [archaeon]|nr:hypothetical protein [archaeon]
MKKALNVSMTQSIMKNSINNKFVFLGILGIFVLFSFILNAGMALSAESNLNISSKDYAVTCIDDSKKIMNDLMNDGFNTKRINDSIKLAEQIFDSQSKIELRGGKVDYSSVAGYCTDIEEIRVSAYEAKDSLYSLEISYNSFKDKIKGYNVNISEVDVMMEDVRQEIINERYEDVPEDSLSVEIKMADIESTSTATSLFYSTVTSGVRSFIIDNYIKILIFIGVLILLFFAYKLRIKRYIVLKKIGQLEAQKKVLKDLIRKAQYGYFHQGEISQGSFSIKMNKYSEMVRDIDRQIPLLNEDLALIESKLKRTEAVVKRNGGESKLRGTEVKRTKAKKVKKIKAKKIKAKRTIRNGGRRR